MDLKAKVAMGDEQTGEVFASAGVLDLASGGISRIELLEIKMRAAALFAGLNGKDLLGSIDAKAGGSKAGRMH